MMDRTAKIRQVKFGRNTVDLEEGKLHDITFDVGQVRRDTPKQLHAQNCRRQRENWRWDMALFKTVMKWQDEDKNFKQKRYWKKDRKAVNNGK